jgi:hypothetical protein
MRHDTLRDTSKLYTLELNKPGDALHCFSIASMNMITVLRLHLHSSTKQHPQCCQKHSTLEFCHRSVGYFVKHVT